MNERENVFDNEEMQNTQLEFDVLTSSEPVNGVTETAMDAKAVVGKPNKKEAKKAKKNAKKEAKKAKKNAKKETKKNNKKAKKNGEKVEKAPNKSAKRKFTGRKLFAWLATVVAIACAVLPLVSLLGPEATQIANVSLLDGFFSAVAPFASSLNVNLEMITSAPAVLGGIYSKVLLVLPVVMLLSVIFAIVATFSSKKAGFFARAIVAMNFAYYFCVGLLFSFLGMSANGGEIAFDLITVGVAGVMLVLLLALTIADLKKKATAPIFSFIFALAMVAMYLYGSVISCCPAVDKMLSGPMYTKNFMLVTFALCAFVFFASTIRLVFTKRKVFDVIFSCVALYGSILVLGGAFFYNTLKTEWFAFATILAFFQLLISVSSAKAQRAVVATAPVVAVEESVEEEVNVEEVEEVEEVPFDEALLPAEEVNLDEQKIGVCENVYTVSVEDSECVATDSEPCTCNFDLNFASTYMKNKQSECEAECEAKAEAPVCKAKAPACESAKSVSSYDWFIESLTFEERQEFVSLFVYKKLGGTATLPDYVAGGDNYTFFRSFFMNLGKYRDRISANLLDKMYNYMTNLY